MLIAGPFAQQQPLTFVSAFCLLGLFQCWTVLGLLACTERT